MTKVLQVSVNFAALRFIATEITFEKTGQTAAIRMTLSDLHTASLSTTRRVDCAVVT